MKNYRSFSDVEESYFRDHPEEMDEYIILMFEEYAKDGDTGALLSSLRVLSRVKGVTKMVEVAECRFVCFPFVGPSSRFIFRHVCLVLVSFIFCVSAPHVRL